MISKVSNEGGIKAAKMNIVLILNMFFQVKRTGYFLVTAPGGSVASIQTGQNSLDVLIHISGALSLGRREGDTSI